MILFMDNEPTRYELVSRRALLKASAGLGIAIVLPAACGNGDAEVFAGALTDQVPLPTTAPVERSPAGSGDAAETVAPQAAVDSPGETVLDAPSSPPAVAPSTAPTQSPDPTATTAPQVAVAGEMIISFTYTQGATGKNERPYLAVWVEDAAGELAATVSLWYQQQRRGERWLDHLHRWYEVDQNYQALGGVDDLATVSSATREAGSYAVAWDGTIAGVAAPPGSYFVCIESAREDGPYSLIRQPIALTGTLAETALPNDGELSAAKVRIDV